MRFRLQVLRIAAAIAVSIPLVSVLYADGLKHTCQSVVTPVTLDATNPEDAEQWITGELCWRGDLKGKTLQLLLHGAGSSRDRWDLPFRESPSRPLLYAYARKATWDGYVTLAVDRVGVGDSSPFPNEAPSITLPLDLTVDASAGALHQLIEVLRAGGIADTKFERIMVVGHSMGSFVAIQLAARYPGDVDGVVLTAYLHEFPPGVADRLFASVVPFQEDGFPAGEPDLGEIYLVTIPGARAQENFYPDTSNPDLVALDETLKVPFPSGEVSNVEELIVDDASSAIDVPVLLLVGEFDQYFCGGSVNPGGNVDCSDAKSVHDWESQFFSPAACLVTRIMRNTGHEWMAHTTANRSFRKISRWARRFVGKDPAAPPLHTCKP